MKIHMWGFFVFSGHEQRWGLLACLDDGLPVLFRRKVDAQVYAAGLRSDPLSGPVKLRRFSLTLDGDMP